MKINVDINKKEDFFEKYNKEVISKELINYLINCAMDYDYVETIIINSKLNLDFKLLLKEGLKKELDFSFKRKRKTNVLQFSLLLLGLFFIFLSVFLQNSIIWHEVILIIGWVPIWEAIDIELFRDSKERKRRNIIRKLLDSDVETKQI